jgi:hypothetical protein
MTHRTRTLCLLLMTAVGLGHAAAAHAGPVEQFMQLALNPNAPDTMLLRYENGGDGVFYTRDGGKTWSLSCATAIDSTLIGSLSIGIAGDGTAMFSGSIGGSSKFSKTLWEDDKHGCSYARIGSLADVWISDIQPDPTDPDVLYAVSSGLETGKLNGLWKRAADGTWTMVGPRERMMITRLRIAKTRDGVRMYESVLRENPIEDAGASGAKFSYDFAIRVSDDRGETWDEAPYTTPDQVSFKLEAIDPTDPDTVIASLTIAEAQGVPAAESKDHVIVSHDRGATFEEYLTVSELGGVVFDAEDRLWIGDGGSIFDTNATQGLWSSTSLAEDAEKVNDGAVQCLAFQPATDTLYACQHQSLATVDRAHGAALEQALLATEVQGFTACDGADMAAACEQQLCGAYCGYGHFAQAPVCEAYSSSTCGPSVAIVEGTSDAGMSAAGGGGGSGGNTSMTDVRDAAPAGPTAEPDAGHAKPAGKDGDSGCSCGVVGRDRGDGAAALWLGALGFVYRARRRARARAQRPRA